MIYIVTGLQPVKEFVQKTRLSVENFNARRKLTNHDFCIISNNCWGGRVYQDLGKPYNTPFVGLFLHSACYIKLLENLEYYLSVPLTFTGQSKYLEELKYPVGLLDDIEVHFMHYVSEQEAHEKWNRRLERMNWENLFVKACDRDYATEDHAKRFEALPYRKVFFSAQPASKFKSHVWFKEFDRSPCVDREMYVYKKYFDVTEWLNQ